MIGLQLASCRQSPLPEENSSGPESESMTAHETGVGETTASVAKFPEEAVWKKIKGSRDWRHLVLHHTASGRGNVESIHELHLARKDSDGNPWMGIGYHFVIGNGLGMEDGAIEPTFRWREQLHGAHAGSSEYNQHGIGIVLVGNFEEQPPTGKQLTAVKRLVAYLRHEYNIPSDRVVGHGEVRATACPGKLFPMADVQTETKIDE